jgi:hypothetical protein
LTLICEGKKRAVAKTIIFLPKAPAFQTQSRIDKAYWRLNKLLLPSPSIHKFLHRLPDLNGDGVDSGRRAYQRTHPVEAEAQVLLEAGDGKVERGAVALAAAGKVANGGFGVLTAEMVSAHE